MVTAIRQDGYGFMWIATEDGLNRFDGLNFTIYRSVPDDPGSLMSNFVRTLFVDRSGTLWIGLINGLMIYDPNLDSFIEIPLYRDTARLQPHVTTILETQSGDLIIGTSGQGLINIKFGEREGFADLELIPKLSSEFIETIFQDFYGRLWIGSENEGVNMYNPSTGEMKSFVHNPRQAGSLRCNYITSVAEDYRRNIYIGTLNGGLHRFNELNNSFDIIPVSNYKNLILPIKSIFSDSNNKLWIGTIGRGLWYVNIITNALEQSNLTTSRLDLDRTKIHAITNDHEGNLWLGLYLRGVLMVAGRSNNFNTISYQPFGQKGIGSGGIMALAEDENNKIWIGTDTYGLYRLNHNTGEVIKFKLNTEEENNLTFGVSSILFDNRDNMWIGTTLDGFFKFEPESGRSLHFRHNPTDLNSLSNDKVQCLELDRSGNIWIGTSGGGLNKFDPETGLFTRFQHDPANTNTLCNDWVNTVFEDSHGHLWIGTYNRISIYDPEADTFRIINTASGLIPNNVIFYITEDSNGYIWIGTKNGLVRYNRNTNTSRIFTTSDGLVNNVVTAIKEDTSGKIWISTHHGISAFCPTNESFKNFFVYDGLQGNEFRRNSALRNTNGALFFGGINGLTWFVPEQITRDFRIPKVYVSDLYLLNQPVRIGEKFGPYITLTQSIFKTDTVQLTWQHNNFSIEFSTIGYNNPERISYQYRLVGFDEDWVTTTSANRRATYTNLAPGKYVFELRAVDNGNLSDTRQIHVFISSPWWATWWFRLLCALFAIIVIYTTILYIKNRIRAKHDKLKLENQKLINEAKIRFFTNISHEILTPLTLITDPLERLMAENKGNKSLMKGFRTMSKNTGRLMRLVSQLLDIRKIEREQMNLSYSQVDLIKFISDIMEAFDYMSIKKEIKFSLLTPYTELFVWIDPDNFDKIIYNVLSNAFKFTPNNGEIKIGLKTGRDLEIKGYLKDYAEISVTDSGIGIPEDKLERIFDRFYQEKNELNINSGTGIGLHLSRSLLELQHGKIFAQNRTDSSGSIFVIRIPLGSAHIANAQITHNHTILNKIPNLASNQYYTDLDTHTEFINDEEVKPNKRANFKILLVNHDEQMRLYLQNELGYEFGIIPCSNGKEAIDMVHYNNPDLVLADLQLPIMDGITLCRKLKHNPLTSHLPVVIISSKTEDEFLNQALQVGVDAYFTKPFNTEKIKRSISNLLINRERIKTKFASGGNINAVKKTYKSVDQALMDKIMDIIEKRISDPALNAMDISRKVGMSRVHLFRRLKKITGQAPSDFIRKIRLQKAAQLLDARAGFVKEIAYEVGFTSLSYFSRSFHEFYGIKPSEYAKRNKDNSTLTDNQNTDEVIMDVQQK